MPTRQTTGRYEMLWDCPACGTQGLLGLTHRFCPNCGAPQDPSRRYFPPEDEKVPVEDNAYYGSDRICPACDAPNSAKSTFCAVCGAPLDGAKAAATRQEQLAGTSDSAGRAQQEDEARKKAKRDAEYAKQAASSGVPVAAKKGAGIFGLGCAFAALVLCIGAVTAVLWHKEAGMVVTGHTWSRAIEVVELRQVQETAWRDQVPADAAGVSCREEQRSTRRVEDGETCVDKRVDKGDGTFDQVKECTPKYREEPVYDARCAYTVQRWTKVDEVRSEGASTKPAPAWPPEPAATGAGIGARKAGDRHETYTVQLRDEAGKTYTCDLPQDRWGGMADGSRWKGSVGVLTGALDCSALQPE